MSNDEFSLIDQAVLGYANGHRLLSASTELSASDTYELAAASDLAPGAHLSGDESYLTGLMLPDGKYYALIRTWAAPEMPRPGCVWSHALLLSRPVTSGQLDLSVLNGLFERPRIDVEGDAFRTRLRVGKRARGQQADKAIVNRLMAAAYQSVPVSSEDTGRAELEGAIFAVWSQQWPRMRVKFTFRSIWASSELKGQTIRLSKTKLKPGSTGADWIEAAAGDAISASISPLRRFLWRYGKDFEPTPPVFPFLVTLYRQTRAPELDPGAATAILAIDAKHGETLKADMLGLEPNEASVVPSLSKPDLVMLAAQQPTILSGYERGVIAAAFSAAPPSEWCGVASGLDALHEKAPSLAKTIEKAILPLATAEALADERTPPRIVAAALAHDPALIGHNLLRRLSSQDNLILLGGKVNVAARSMIADVLVERPYVDDFEAAPEELRTEVFQTAVKAFAGFRLHDGWITRFRRDSGHCLALLAGLDPRLHLAGVTMLDFPMGSAGDIASVLALVETQTDYPDRAVIARLQTYLLEMCIRHEFSRRESVLVRFLPALRQTILRAALPLESQQQLSRLLPEINDYWDLNRRLLKLIRREYKAGKALDMLVGSLELTDDEYAYATNQKREGMVRKFFRAFLGS